MDCSSAQLDKSQLAITLLELLGLVDLGRTGPVFKHVQSAVAKIKSQELRALLNGLLAEWMPRHTCYYTLMCTAQHHDVQHLWS